MKIGVHGKEFTRQSARYIEAIFEVLHRNGATIYISPKFARNVRSSRFWKFPLKVFESGMVRKSFRFFLSLGGDGTLLESVTYIGKSEVPILAINTGRLGFLATISREESEEAVTKLLEGEYTIDKRTLLRLVSNRDLFKGINFALNDFTLMKKDSSSMITVHTFIDGEFLNSYWADGIIISTPTGSTGYSLSCGGPLVFPRSNNFIITPVSPHNLTARPIVVADSSVVTFRVEGRSKKFLVSLDSRFATVDDAVKLKITKENFQVNLVQLESHHYFNTLRQKLNWGLDIRN